MPLDEQPSNALHRSRKDPLVATWAGFPRGLGPRASGAFFLWAISAIPPCPCEKRYITAIPRSPGRQAREGVIGRDGPEARGPRNDSLSSPDPPCVGLLERPWDESRRCNLREGSISPQMRRALSSGAEKNSSGAGNSASGTEKPPSGTRNSASGTEKTRPGHKRPRPGQGNHRPGHGRPRPGQGRPRPGQTESYPGPGRRCPGSRGWSPVCGRSP